MAGKSITMPFLYPRARRFNARWPSVLLGFALSFPAVYVGGRFLEQRAEAERQCLEAERQRLEAERQRKAVTAHCEREFERHMRMPGDLRLAGEDLAQCCEEARRAA